MTTTQPTTGDTKMTKQVTISYTDVELAVKTEHGAWELLGDFGTLESAKNAAKEYARLGQDHISECGVMVFGISEDPASGQYEISYSVEVGSGEAW